MLRLTSFFPCGESQPVGKSRALSNKRACAKDLAKVRAAHPAYGTGQLQRLAQTTKKISGDAMTGLLQPCVAQGRQV